MWETEEEGKLREKKIEKKGGPTLVDGWDVKKCGPLWRSKAPFYIFFSCFHWSIV